MMDSLNDSDISDSFNWGEIESSSSTDYGGISSDEDPPPPSKTPSTVSEVYTNTSDLSPLHRTTWLSQEDEGTTAKFHPDLTRHRESWAAPFMPILTMLIFIGIAAIFAILNRPISTYLHGCICAVCILASIKYPAFCIFFFIKAMRVNEKHIVKYLMITVLFMPIMEDVSVSIKGAFQEIRCASAKQREALSKNSGSIEDLGNKTQEMFHKMSENATENEGKMIEKMLIYYSGIEATFEDMDAKWKKVTDFVEFCDGGVANMSGKTCAAAFKPVHKEMESVSVFDVNMTPTSKSAETRVCGDIKRKAEEVDPCKAMRRKKWQLGNLTQEKAHSEMSNADDEDESEDPFSAEVQHEQIVETGVDLLETILKMPPVVETIQDFLSLLVDMKMTMVFILMILLCCNSYLSLRKFSSDPSYCNNLIREDRQELIEALKRAEAWPLQKEDFKHFDRNPIEFDIKRIFSKPVPFIPIVIMACLPFLHNWIHNKVKEPWFIGKENFKNKEFMECYGLPTEPWIEYPVNIAIGTSVTHFFFILLDAFFMRHLEAISFEYFHPEHIAMRTEYLVLYLKRNRISRFKVYMEFLLNRCQLCQEWIWGQNYHYCRDPLCPSFLCMNCECH